MGSKWLTLVYDKRKTKREKKRAQIESNSSTESSTCKRDIPGGRGEKSTSNVVYSVNVD